MAQELSDAPPLGYSKSRNMKEEESHTSELQRKSSSLHHWVEITPQPDTPLQKLSHLCSELKKSRMLEKWVFLLAVVTIIFLTHATVYAQWLLPFYYVISTPILILVRVVMYWKNRWHYFLLDFCYFANIIVYIYMWVPNVGELFAVTFALSNGPLLWAVLVYRNSLVFHSVDKVTSGYIHILPGLLSFGVRWYPEETSRYWFKDFVPDMPELSPIYLLVVPFACFLFHSFLYFVVIHCLAKPTEEEVTSFSYLGKKEDSCLFKIFNVCGKRFRPLMFYVFNWIFCIVTLGGVFLVYSFYIAHCIFMIFMCSVIIWNGGNYYIDVFSVRGFVEDECE